MDSVDAPVILEYLYKLNEYIARNGVLEWASRAPVCWDLGNGVFAARPVHRDSQSDLERYRMHRSYHKAKSALEAFVCRQVWRSIATTKISKCVKPQSADRRIGSGIKNPRITTQRGGSRFTYSVKLIRLFLCNPYAGMTF